MKGIPPVQKYMTTTPFAINANSTVEEALRVMGKHGVRHLPVVLGEGAFGIVSDRDLKYASALAGFNARTDTVQGICEEKPYVTTPAALVSDVSRELADRRVGSALILDNGHLVGIFTTTDACRALGDLFEKRIAG